MMDIIIIIVRILAIVPLFFFIKYLLQFKKNGDYAVIRRALVYIIISLILLMLNLIYVRLVAFFGGDVLSRTNAYIVLITSAVWGVANWYAFFSFKNILKR